MNNDAPLVTIVTPTFNHEQYLGQCIESVLAQTEARWEMLVVDDGSIDGTQSVALGYDDPRIRYTRQDHAGILRLAETLNGALEAARGDIIATLAGDDFWPTDKLETQIPSFDEPDVVLSWGRVGVVDSAGHLVRFVPPARVIRRSRRHTRADTFEHLLGENTIYASSVMFRRDVFRSIGGFRQPSGIPIEDWPTWLEFSRQGRFAVLDHILGFYRRHEAQATAVFGDDMAGIQDWLATYVRQMSAEERRELSCELGVQDSELQSIVERQEAARSFALGRRRLQNGQTQEAKRALRKALPAGTNAVRGRAAVALALSWFGVNAETVLGRIRRLRRISVVNRTRSDALRWRRRRTP